MKNLRNLLAAITLMVVLMVGTSSAKTGLLVSDLNGNNPQPCSEKKDDSKTEWGIIITSFTGIIITSFTGIIITDVVETPVDCGIIITD